MHKWATLSFVIGLSLLTLNVSGVFISLRNPAIYRERTQFPDDITLTEEDVWRIVRQDYDSVKDCAVAINSAVNRGIAHYWGEDVAKYNLSIPLRENYLLFAATHVYAFLTASIPAFRDGFEQFNEPSDVLRKYEFSDYKKALERGVGLCSQHAIIVAQLLKHKGIDTRIVYLQGHVVAMARVDPQQNRWWVLDPDFGVVIRHDMTEIEKDPKLIAPYYQEQGVSPPTLRRLIRVYAREGNNVYPSVAEYHGKDRLYKYYFEYLLYLLKWVIPIGLISPYFRMRIRLHTTTNQGNAV